MTATQYRYSGDVAPMLEPKRIQPRLAERFGELGDVLTSRFVHTITRKGRRHRRVLIVTREDIFVATKEGIARRRVGLGQVTSGWFCASEAVVAVQDPHVNPSLYFEDIEGTVENSGMPRVVDVLAVLLSARRRSQHVYEVASPEDLRGKATFRKGEGYVSARVMLSRLHPGRTFAPSLASASDVSIDVDYDFDTMRATMDGLRHSNAALEQEVEALRSRVRASASPRLSPRINVTRDSGAETDRVSFQEDGVGTAPAVPGSFRAGSARAETQEEIRKLQTDALLMPDAERFMLLPLSEGGGEGGDSDDGERSTLMDAQILDTLAENHALEREQARLRSVVRDLRREKAAERRRRVKEEIEVTKAEMEGMLNLVEGYQRANAEMACSLLVSLAEQSPLQQTPAVRTPDRSRRGISTPLAPPNTYLFDED